MLAPRRVLRLQGEAAVPLAVAVDECAVSSGARVRVCGQGGVQPTVANQDDCAVHVRAAVSVQWPAMDAAVRSPKSAALSVVSIRPPQPGPWVTPWRLAAAALPFTVASVILLALTLSSPWQSYSAQNTVQTMQWNFADCYVVPTGIADGVVTQCDPLTPQRLVFASLAIDGLSLLALAYLVAQPFLPSFVPGSELSVERALLGCRGLALLRVAHTGMVAGAMVAKNASLPAGAWSTHLSGWSCLAAAIGMSCAALIAVLALSYHEAWLDPLPTDSVLEDFQPSPQPIAAGGRSRMSGSASAGSPSRAASVASGRGSIASDSSRRSRHEVALKLAGRQQPERGGSGEGAAASRLRGIPELPAELLRSV